MAIELSHRAAAGAVILLLGALAFVAWRGRGERPRMFRLSVIAFGLVLFQAVLGAIVVWLELEAESVVLHLATALTLLALLVYITTVAYAIEGRLLIAGDASAAARARFAAGAVLILLLVGSYVTGRDAGYVFADWPLMDGAVVPDLSKELWALHFLHRALAALVAVVVAVVGIGIIRRRETLPLQAKLAHAAMGAYAVEILVGAMNILTKLNAAVVTLHLALGALIWMLFAAIAATTSREVVMERVRPTTGRTALEVGG